MSVTREESRPTAKAFVFFLLQSGANREFANGNWMMLCSLGRRSVLGSLVASALRSYASVGTAVITQPLLLFVRGWVGAKSCSCGFPHVYYHPFLLLVIPEQSLRLLPPFTSCCEDSSLMVRYRP